MKENSYGKVDAVINLYEKTKEMYDSLGDKMKTKEEKKLAGDALNNAPNKKAQDKLYKAGLEVGNSKVKKVKEKVAEKNRERGK